jgi:hypothetical protein
MCAQIQHAGEGGLYAELVQDRSFEGLAYTQGFLQSSTQELVVSSSGCAFILNPPDSA